MDSIIKGTTPTINVNIPGMAELQPVEIWFSFKSGNDVYTFAKSTSGEEITVVGETISKLLTQEQTLAFNVGILYMQIRILDNLELAYATPWLSFMVEDVIQGGAMTAGEEDPTINVEATVTQLYEDVDELKASFKSLSMSICRYIEGATLHPTNALPFYSPSMIVRFSPTKIVDTIAGKDHVSVSIADESGDDPVELTQAFGEIVYGGEFDFVSGKLKKIYGYLSPYAGEEIPEPWISSKDEYVPGTIPTAGAQVVYPLETPVYVEYPAREIIIKNDQTLSTLDGWILLTYLGSILDEIEDLDEVIAALEEIENIKAQVALLEENKANIDGYYETMTVGDAEQLVSNVGVTDEVPYNLRASGGGVAVGDRMNDVIVGGTVAWNQLVQNGDFSDGTANWFSGMSTTISVTNKVLTLASTGTQYYVSQQLATLVNHKYAVFVTMKANEAHNSSSFLVLGWGAGANASLGIVPTTRTAYAKILAPTQAGTQVAIYGSTSSESTAGESVTVENAMVIDLTAAFGSTIADYIYTLEQSTAGAGIAFFKKLFPKPYYPYNAGELMSVQAAVHQMVGFNQWDEETEPGGIDTTTGAETTSTTMFRSKNYNSCLPNTSYYMHAPTTSQNAASIRWYDAAKNYIGYTSASIATRQIFVAPTNAWYFRIVSNASSYGATYKNDICINLSDPERNGEYESYQKHSYSLDETLVLRGIPKFDSFNKLYFDGDTYEPDGTVTRKYGIVDLGTLNWLVVQGGFGADVAGIIESSSNALIGNIICSKYVTIKGQEQYNSTKVGIALGGSGVGPKGTVRISDPAYTDAATFKAAMSGVMLVYELAEPTTETAEPFADPQVVDSNGTEEYVDERTVAIPVGHKTFYQVDLKGKLEKSPDSPSADGLYLMQRANGVNQYTPILFPASDIPAPPETNGSYVLVCTYSNGTVTYSWESRS